VRSGLDLQARQRQHPRSRTYLSLRAEFGQSAH
jgi:hypothetical protein